jgi:hypothetical protein
MIIKASVRHLRITEVPTRLSVDGRDRPPHLRSWHDGWRTLRFFLLLSPRALFLYPGATIFSIGVVSTAILFAGEVTVGRIKFAEHTMVLTAAMINIGFQAMLFWAFAKVIAIQRGLLLPDIGFERLRRALPLEGGLGLGVALVVLGLGAFIAALSEWSDVAFGQLPRGIPMRLVIVSSTALVLGSQILYGSFFLYVIDYRAAQRQILDG